jgi:hypothetical protein
MSEATRSVRFWLRLLTTPAAPVYHNQVSSAMTVKRVLFARAGRISSQAITPFSLRLSRCESRHAILVLNIVLQGCARCKDAPVARNGSAGRWTLGYDVTSAKQLFGGHFDSP